MDKKIRWFFILLFVIGFLSLTGAYFLQPSPAWICDFGYAFTTENNELKDTGIYFLGLVIELTRFILLLATAYLIYTALYKEHIKEITSDITSSQFRFKSYYYSFSIVTILVSLCVIFYHISLAPQSLSSGDAKYWDIIINNNDNKLKEVQGKCWNNASNIWQEYKENVAASGYNELSKLNTKLDEDGMRREMYYVPYIWYLPYSFINYVVLLIPIVFLAWFSIRAETSYLIELVGKSNRSLHEPTINFSRLIQDIEEIANKFIGYCSNHAWLIVGSLLIAAYELIIGHRTLAHAANMFTVFGIIALISFLIILIKISINYQKIYNHAKDILIEYKNKGTETDKKMIQGNLEKLKELSIVNQFLQSKETYASMLLVSVLSIYVANKFLENI
jgi:predicted outer membrane lipoprotein